MTSFMEYMFCINRHIRKFILFQCQDGARGGQPPVATPLKVKYKSSDHELITFICQKAHKCSN